MSIWNFEVGEVGYGLEVNSGWGFNDTLPDALSWLVEEGTGKLNGGYVVERVG